MDQGSKIVEMVVSESQITEIPIITSVLEKTNFHGKTYTQLKIEGFGDNKKQKVEAVLQPEQPEEFLIKYE
jgi:hypothetical protein